MTNAAPSAEAELASFIRRTSPNGLFLRYAAGRVRGFAARQVLTLLGAGALAVLEYPLLGLLVLLLGLTGDAADCVLLHNLVQRFGHGEVPPGWRRAALAAGWVQGATIAASVALAWTHTDNHSVEFFATAFLIGAAINAGLARPHCAPMADLRMATFGVTLSGLMLFDVVTSGDVAGWLWEHAYFLIATLMLAYATWNFLRYASVSFARTMRIERKLLEEQRALAQSTAALAEREAQARKLALVAEQANDSIIICDPEGRIEWVNPTFTRLTGFPAESAIGRRPGEVLNGEGSTSDAVSAIEEARAAGKPWRVEILNHTREGQPIWIETIGTPIRGADGKLTMTIQVERDITSAKTHAAELAEASARVAVAAATRSRFLATMSHEIRTPMNAVIGMAELLADSAINADQRAQVEVIISSGRSLVTLINDILDMSRLEARGMQFLAEPMDVVEVTRGVARLLRPLAEGKGLRLLSPSPDMPPVWISGDAGRVQQVLTNMIGNAIRYTREGEVSVMVEPGAPVDGRVPVAIRVADTGIGIPPDRQEAIFESFTQSDNAISREFGGSGLGLAIARELARCMGGDITLRSAPGEGSEFTLHLALPVAAPAAAPGTARSVAPPDLAGRHILLAEDNATNRLILRKLVERTGAALEEAADGAEAVAAFSRRRPDFVFLDMQMPLMDGLAAARAIRAQETADPARAVPCPLVMLTANAFAEDAEASLAAGCDAFLTKPVAPSEIYATLDRFLGPARTSPA